MKNKLPNIKASQGFTLVELMIAIAIIAILATVGLTIYSGIQKNARDARRRADVDAIAKAFETNKASNAETYKALTVAMFASGSIPTDPSRSYCADGTPATGDALAADPAAWTSTDCKDAAGATILDGIVSATVPADTSYKWKVCASLESGTVFCKANQQ